MSEKKRLVLCIDDDPSTLSLLSYLLGHGSYEVQTAAEGAPGLQMAQDSHPQVILLDVEMPGMDGYEVCRQLQKNPTTSCIPVVFLTSHAKEQDREKAFVAGAADFLSKPFHLNSLLEKVKAQIDRTACWQKLTGDNADDMASLAHFMEFKIFVARKAGFSAEQNIRWSHLSALEL